MLAAGDRLDRFEIRELLGAGGMGEVYRAHDSRLRRDVALKLLPDGFLRDPERRARFEREAQVLASLNHPNIAALHEVIAVPGSQCLVMELVEGETLAQRIHSGGFSVPEALGIAAQVAAALEAAHEQGVVHRDLKPGNVKLRPDGGVKLLDFGLAKVVETVHPASAADVTLTAHGAPDAAAGAPRVLGSPSCMSPEQARGLPVDRRTDVWAFGCLLYEMLCGVRAFDGTRATDVIARILEREPDLSLLPPDLPAPVHRLLRRCLEKDRRKRLRDIGDARLELLDALEHQASVPAGSGPLAARASRLRPGTARRRWVGAAGIVAVLAAAVWFASRPGSTPEPLPVARFVLDAPGASGLGLAISADGRQVAYLSEKGLMARALDRLDAHVVTAANLVQGSPFFSPDGLWLGFTGWDALRKVPVAGGEAVTLVDRVYPAGTWKGSDIYYGDTRGLFRIPAAGGEPTKLVATEGVEQVVSVEVLPGRAVLFTVIPTRGNVPRMAANMSTARIEALDLRTGRRHVVLRGGGRPRITRTGHLLYAGGGTLYAVGFDAARLQTRGKAVPVIQTDGLIEFDVSSQGTLVYKVSSANLDREMVWVDRQGREESLGAPPMPYVYPRLSPDGQRIAIDVSDDSKRDVWIWDRRRATLELFSKDPAGNPLVAWSPDGRGLAYGSERSGVSNVYWQEADGSGTPRQLFDSPAVQMPISYAPDGRLLVSVTVPGQQRDIHVMSRNSPAQLEPLIHSAANELWAEVSPDGRWLAYDSDESGQFEVYVRPFPHPYEGSRWQISSAGGRQPLWARDGRELFYRDYSGALKAVPVTPGEKFIPGRPGTVFEGSGYSGSGSQGGGRTYDVAPDGARFLMLKSAPGRPPEIFVVLNWFEELRRLAPLD
jgi:serine/threonine-protein kinase